MISRVRRIGGAATREVRLDEAHAPAAPDDPRIADVEEREETARLRRFINALRPAYRQILLLRHEEQLSTAEAASRLGVSEETARKRYVRALHELWTLRTRAYAAADRLAEAPLEP